MTIDRNRHDVVIVGGGLAGGLLALAIRELRPDLSLLLLEQAERFGGNHIWSFFDSDIPEGAQWLVDPMVIARWPDHGVAFPAFRRTLSLGYNSMDSAHFDAHMRACLGDDALTGQTVTEILPNLVRLADGRDIAAPVVIDARGGEWSAPHCGWQKFVGQRLQVPAGHGLQRPVVMDACVEQIDGYRFVYCLPLTEHIVFVEDTYYSDDPELDQPALRARIADYAATQGWRDVTVVEEEAGVLPVIYGGAFADIWPESGASGDVVGRLGLRAGLFHPLTSYSVPIAVRTALQLCAALPSAEHLHEIGAGRAITSDIRNYARRHWRKGRFYRMLARMMFHSADPHNRYKILQHFYRLPEPLIARFYAAQTSIADIFRILSGRPPVSVLRAISALLGKRT